MINSSSHRREVFSDSLEFRQVHFLPRRGQGQDELEGWELRIPKESRRAIWRVEVLPLLEAGSVPDMEFQEPVLPQVRKVKRSQGRPILVPGAFGSYGHQPSSSWHWDEKDHCCGHLVSPGFSLDTLSPKH